ncbi:MAG TPA: bacteriohopanetetrol glucosamine biosynthesis glycosyltransferase HpnI [Blastocatellia bacterium]|nr:bacteriohopanetetrol glucosamine biosynthesis glycosyltransferase HpnI [Blastocatellia bacterium]
MHLFLIALKVVLIGCTLAADAFYMLSIIAAFRFFSRAETDRLEAPSPPGADHRSPATDHWPPAEYLPPVSIMVPLYGADFKAFQNYARLCRQNYPDFQLVFGVREANDSSIPIIEKLKADFPERDIELVISGEVIGQNLKVSNLQNMYSRVRHDHIVILDSDIRVTADYLRKIIGPLADPRVGLVTCLYRAAETPDLASRLEAVGITAEFAPGVLMAWMLEGVKFALGSTMATTRARLDSIGGFRALADYLADDFMLGNLIAAAGYEVRLSKHIVETAMPPAGISGMLRHQMRWARSTRISRPLGYLGLILTYGTALAVLTVIVDRASGLSLGLLGLTLLVRLTMAWLIGVHWIHDRVLRRDFWLLPLRDLLSFVIWCSSWIGRRVEWRGRVFEVARDGKMIQVGGPSEFRESVTEAGRSRVV